MSAPLTDILGWGFLVAGAAFSLVGGIGLLRLPDLFTRMHAAGITDTLGAGLILPRSGAWLIGWRMRRSS